MDKLKISVYKYNSIWEAQLLKYDGVQDWETVDVAQSDKGYLELQSEISSKGWIDLLNKLEK